MTTTVYLCSVLNTVKLNLLWSKGNLYSYNTYSIFNVQKSHLTIQIWLFMWRYFYMIFISEVFSIGISPYGCGGRWIVHACKDFNQFLIRPNKSRCRFSCFWLNTYKVQTTQNVKKKHAGNISVRVCMCSWGGSQYGLPSTSDVWTQN